MAEVKKKVAKKKRKPTPKPTTPARLTPSAKPALRLPVKVQTRAPIKRDRPRPRSLGDRLLVKSGL